METVAFRTCPLCEATCGLELQLTDGVVTRTRGDADDVFSAGFLCPKGTTLGHFHDDPDRLRQPLVRIDGEHVAVTWDEAFRVIKERFVAHRDPDSDAAAIYLGNPVVHGLDLLLYGRTIITALGTSNVYSASTVDQRPGTAAASSTDCRSPSRPGHRPLRRPPAPRGEPDGAMVMAGPGWPGRIDTQGPGRFLRSRRPCPHEDGAGRRPPAHSTHHGCAAPAAIATEPFEPAAIDPIQPMPPHSIG